MKKLFALLLIVTGLSTSAFALSISAGGVFNGGGTLSSEVEYQGFTVGGGAFINLNLFSGVGVQAEFNVSTSQIIVNRNSLYIVDDYTVYDLPVMLWANFQLGSIIAGAGAGLNLSVVENLEYADVNKFSVGFAAGANVIFPIGRHFGILVGAHGVFDLTPHISVTEFDRGSVYTFASSNWTRQSIYGNIGLEYMF